MKKSILLIFSFLIVNILSAQIGINTINPLAMFHMDSDGLNSTTPTATEQLNDVVITKDGNLGIGIINPLNKLSINSTSANTELHLPNGASSGKVLTSDANGNGTWISGAVQYQTMVRGAISPAGDGGSVIYKSKVVNGSTIGTKPNLSYRDCI